jgi:hypothetical protein
VSAGRIERCEIRRYQEITGSENQGVGELDFISFHLGAFDAVKEAGGDHYINLRILIP